ncbi:MAG: hypothetical protein ACE5FI_18560 [Anaerolineales bacterium]
MAMTVKDLRSTSPYYDAGKIQRYQALYCGGDLFRNKIDQFLIKRRSEERQIKGLASVDMFRERAKWAQYINRAGGLIDWFRAAVFPDLRLTVENAEDERAEYWLGLNEDADGRGRPLAMVARDVLVQALVHGRAYLRAHVKTEEATRSDPESYRVWMRPLTPASVIDWSSTADDDEDLDWVKIYSALPMRSPGAVYGADAVVRHRWVVTSETEITTYEAVQRGPQPLDEGLMVEGITRPHDFGELPIFDARITPDQWVMDRIADVVVSLYNAEAALSYALMMQAYAQPVFHLVDSDLSKVVVSEAHAIRLEAGEKFEYVTPPANVFEPLASNIERLKSAFYEVLQAMAINAASIPQAGRLSGAAVSEMRDPMKVLLTSFASPILEVLWRWVRAVQAYRGDEDLQIEIELPAASAPDAGALQGVIDGTQT